MSYPYSHPRMHNPVEITGNIRVHHSEPKEPVEIAEGIYEPAFTIIPTREELPIMGYSFFCHKCSDYHDEVGECPYGVA